MDFLMETMTSIESTKGVSAEPDEEWFDLLDEFGNPLGTTEKRKIVHAKGLYHRAVYCFVFNGVGELLLQQRSHAKKIGPGQWDLSVAEHLGLGEQYLDAVVRGLNEELGINTTKEQLKGPLGPTHIHQLCDVEKGVYDNEFVQSYALMGYVGRVKYNDEEVMSVRYVSLESIQEEIKLNPDSFTSWFRKEMVNVASDLLLMTQHRP